MKLTLTIEYDVKSHDAGRELVNEVMPALYGLRLSADPAEWTWEVSETDPDEDPS